LTINSNESLSIRNLRWAGGLAVLMLLGFGVTFSWQSWQAEKTDATQHLSALAELGANALDSHFFQLERALELLSRDLFDKDGALDAQRAQFLLKRFIEVHAELPDIALVRSDGQILVTAKSAPGAALPSAAKEPSFIQARDELLTGQTLSIARPLIGLVIKEWVIPFRYGIRDRRGNLVFIINAGMPLSKPQSFWENAPLPEGTAAGLRRDDDYLVSRYPIPSDVDLKNFYGKPLTGVLGRYLRQEQYPVRGVVEGTGSIAGAGTLFVFHRLAHYPLTFFILTPLSNIRAEWWREVRIPYLLMLALMAGGFAVYRWTLKRQIGWESERQQTAAALQVRGQQLGLILDAVPAQVAYFDSQQRYRFVNRAFEQWNGVPRAEMLGKTLRDFRGEGAYRQRQPHIQAVLSGRATTVEGYFDFQDIGRRYVLANYIPDLAPDGMVRGFYTVVTDLTDRKEAHDQELEREKTLRNTLVREVHHRVKNALQGAVLLMETSGKAQPDLSAALEPAIARLYAMAAVFGLQASEGEQHVLLCKLVPEICGMLAKAMECSIEPAIETDFVRSVRIADNEAVPVALIINELVFNAIKHGRLGEPVKVFLGSDGGSASVRVVTPGAVLPPGFDFESGAGTGTGLRLVKSMLREDRVKVAITSGPGGVSAELVLRPPAIMPAHSIASA
jgi:PAS domain S-box-containing protein